jgi:hypothetical protein
MNIMLGISGELRPTFRFSPTSVDRRCPRELKIKRPHQTVEVVSPHPHILLVVLTSWHSADTPPSNDPALPYPAGKFHTPIYCPGRFSDGQSEPRISGIPDVFPEGQLVLFEEEAGND